MSAEREQLFQAIRAYVPALVVENALTPHTPVLAGRETRLQVAVLFADVSGFTAMSEKLAKLGKEGAEELTRVLNAYFSTMIEVVHTHGGQIIKFGGDAMTCAFVSPPEAELSLADLLLEAGICGLVMQEKMTAFSAVETRGGLFSLKMKIGISGGTALSISVGQAEEGLEYVLAGRPLDQMASAEHHAQADEVVLDGTCLSDFETWADPHFHLGPSRNGFYPLTATKHALPRQLDPDHVGGRFAQATAATQQKYLAQLIPYLPPTVYSQLEAKQRQFVGEHRRVVSLFINFTGLDYEGDPSAGQKLQTYFSAMQEIIHAYGGRLNRVITGDKGSLLHLIFGAPITHEDNEIRAVGCALALQNHIRSDENLAFITGQRIGVATGYVFAGNVGSDTRREYTVMGDVVNLSARLMQAAPEMGILLDSETVRYAEARFVCDALAPIQVKGKSDPIAIWRPIGPRSETSIWNLDQVLARTEGLLVGRQAELAQVDQLISQAKAGTGQILAISGEAGVGKTRFLQAVLKRLKAEQAVGLGGSCVSYGAQIPYLPWLDFFNSYFDLLSEEPPLEKVTKVRRKLAAIDPELALWGPLIGQLLGLPIEETSLTAALSPQLRQQRLFAITLALIRHRAQQVPLLVLVFEDIHWIDDTSLELLTYVARNIHSEKILLLTLLRPTLSLSEWTQFDHLHSLELGDLSAEDALTLVQYRLNQPEVPETLRERVLQGGESVNPFFVEELLNALIDQGYLKPQADGPGYNLHGDLRQAELPNSVQALVMSRIDRLDENSKLTIKVASVIGRAFKYQTLHHVYPVEVTGDQLHHNLNTLRTVDLTPLDRPAPEWEYIFKHATTQDVAYESLLFAHRRELHDNVGRYLEAQHQDNLLEYYEVLAHHYSHSTNTEKSWDYLLKAASKARHNYANEAAISYYQQALALPIENELRYAIHEALADVYQLVGQYDEALEHYARALAQEPPTLALTASLHRRMAKTWELQGQYDQAQAKLEEALGLLEASSAKLEQARVYNALGWLAMQRGHYEEAIQQCEIGLQVLEAINRTSLLSEKNIIADELQHSLGTIFLRTGQYEKAVQAFETSIASRNQRGDLYGSGRSYLNLAVVYWNQGNQNQAVEHMTQSLEIFKKIGYAHGTAMCYNNLGGANYQNQNYQTALDYYQRSLQIRQEIGDLTGIAQSYSNMGETYLSLEKYSDAIRHLTEAVAMFAEIGDKPNLVEAHKQLAQTHLALSELEQAHHHAETALQLAQDINLLEAQGCLHRIIGQIHHRAERPEQAQAAFLASVETLQQTANKAELGQSYLELARYQLEHAPPAAAQSFQQAKRIFEELDLTQQLTAAEAGLAQAQTADR